MRILVIASELPPVSSGVARTVSRVVDGLRDRGHQVETLSRADGAGFNVGEFRFSTLATKWVRLGRLCEGYDVVNVHGPAPFVSDALLARSRFRPDRRPPIVHTHHSLVEIVGRPRASRWYNEAHRRLNRHADRLIVTTPSYRRIVQTGRTPPVEVIPWGIDTDRFAGSRPATYSGDRPLRALFVGQMRPYKGVPTLLSAAAQCQGIDFTVVGSGPQSDEYRATAEEMGLENVRMLGAVCDDELTPIFLRSDVLTLPSHNRSEAFGLVLLEGMASGCVPVASNLPGIDDVVGRAGPLVPPGDADALAATLRSLADDPDGTAALQRAARTSAARFSWDRTIDRYERVLAEVAASGHRTTRALQ